MNKCGPTTWSPVSDAFGECLGNAGLLKKVCPWEQGFESVYSHFTSGLLPSQKKYRHVSEENGVLEGSRSTSHVQMLHRCEVKERQTKHVLATRCSQNG